MPTLRPALRPVQRTAAYALLREAGAVLLVRASARTDLAGRWFLPGGGVRHAEHPRDAVLRELHEETGVQGLRPRPRGATADVIDLPNRGVQVHTIRLVYHVEARLPIVDELRPELDGTSDLVRLVPLTELPSLPLMPYVANLFGLPSEPVTATAPARPMPLLDLPLPTPAGVELGAEPVVVVQRPGVYASLVADGRILLTHLEGSGGLWTLPGGGIDFGEEPMPALTREVHEETGLPYTPGPLLEVLSRHFTGRAPTGRLQDFHGISLLSGGTVPTDVAPRVVEVGGSTDAVAWHRLDDVAGLRTTLSVQEAVRRWRRQTRR